MREKSEWVASHRLPVPPKDQVVLHTQSGLVTYSILKKPSLEEADTKETPHPYMNPSLLFFKTDVGKRKQKKMIVVRPAPTPEG